MCYNFASLLLAAHRLIRHRNMMMRRDWLLLGRRNLQHLTD
uniref:Uncharacterized protein n=1 Tax=Triticum urartu TaxID=4572 RepID=A0A8R7V6P7_TRIUA